MQSDRNNPISRFQGSSSISSDEYFGNSQEKQNRKNFQGPDLSAIKEDFKDSKIICKKDYNDLDRYIFILNNLE